MKVCIIPSFYPTDDYPYRGIFFKEQAREINDNEINISIIYPELRSLRSVNIAKFKKFHFQKRMYFENSIKVYRAHRWNFFKTHSEYSLGNKAWIQSAKNLFSYYVQQEGLPDLIHAHCCMAAGIAAMEISQKYKIPYIITEHSTMYARNAYRVQDIKILRKSMLLAKKVISVSDPFKRLISQKLNIPADSISVIPNFIDTDFFKPQGEKKSCAFQFTTISSLNNKKRVDRLLHAFSIAFQNNSDVRLVIGGEGYLKDNLQLICKDLDLQNKVFFKGALSREEVKSILSNTDCFVLASDVETFGVVLIEAMSMGIPVISTKSGGPEDIITSSDGYLVNKDVESLSSAMKDIYINRKSFNSFDIRQRIVDNFSSYAVVSTYRNLYKSVLCPND